MQQYPREQAEVVAHCALLYGVRCLGVQASTSGALTLEQLRRLSGYADTPLLTADGSRMESVEADFDRLAAAEVEVGGTAAEGTIPDALPPCTTCECVSASTAIRGAADAWEVEADAVDRGLRRRRIQPPPRPRAPRESESDTDGGSNAALENQLHALETELADLKASVSAGSTLQGKEHSAAVDKLMQLSTTADVDEHTWQAEPPSDRDSVKVVRTGLDFSPHIRPFSFTHTRDNMYDQPTTIVVRRASISQQRDENFVIKQRWNTTWDAAERKANQAPSQQQLEVNTTCKPAVVLVARVPMIVRQEQRRAAAEVERHPFQLLLPGYSQIEKGRSTSNSSRCVLPRFRYIVTIGG